MKVIAPYFSICHLPATYLSHSFRVIILIKFCHSFEGIQGFSVRKILVVVSF